MRRGIFLAALLVSSTAHADVGTALSSSYMRYLTGLGYSSIDPRVSSTIKAIQTRAAATATAAAVAGTAASWANTAAAAAAGTTTVGAGVIAAAAGIAIAGGITAYRARDGSWLTTRPGQTIDHYGTIAGSIGYKVIGPGECISGSLEGASVCYVQRTQPVKSIVSVSTTSITSGQYYDAGIRGSGTVIWRSTLTNAEYTSYFSFIYAAYPQIYCPPGSFLVGSACVFVNADLMKTEGTYSVWSTFAAWVNSLGATANQPATPPKSTPAELWRDAAAQPGYSGLPAPAPGVDVPWSPDVPAPTPSEWAQTPVSAPIPAPAGAPVATNPAASSPQTNLGDDPNMPAPTLETPPTRIFKPISDLFTDWRGWSVPSHQSTCPTWSFSPSIAGRVFAITLDSHCPLIEQNRSLILSAAMLSWAILAIFIVLGA